MRAAEFTTELAVDEGWKDAAAAGALATGLAFGGTAAGAEKKIASQTEYRPATTQTVAKSAQAKPAVPQPVAKSVTGTQAEQVLRQEAARAGLVGAELIAFLSQCAHETLNFKTLKEIGGKLDFRKYDPKFAPRKAEVLGNTQIGDGAKFKGRGYIQLTGRYNYKKAGEALSLPLEQRPEMVEDPTVAAKVAVWFWKNRVQPKVDNYSDVQAVTKPINPGLHGLPSRQEKFDTYKAAQNGKISESDDEHRAALRQTGFWGKQGAGCLFLAQDTGRICIAHRSGQVEQPNTWGTWGGAIDSGEDPAIAVQREVKEEAGYTGPLHLIPLYTFKHRSGFKYYNFLALIDKEFTPITDWETQGSDWFEYGDWPTPLHPGLVTLLRDPGSIATIQKYASKEMLDELYFLGSECTKDCSGHRAGYRWSKDRGDIDAGSWSQSFNNGAALAKAGR